MAKLSVRGDELVVTLLAREKQVMTSFGLQRSLVRIMDGPSVRLPLSRVREVYVAPAYTELVTQNMHYARSMIVISQGHDNGGMGPERLFGFYREKKQNKLVVVYGQTNPAVVVVLDDDGLIRRLVVTTADCSSDAAAIQSAAGLPAPSKQAGA